MRWLACVFVVAAGCVGSEAVQCSFGICPEGRACDEVNQQCVYPDQLIDCAGVVDGELCDIGDEVDAGICNGEICQYPRCGDAIVTGEEQCDNSVPVLGTCVDSAYDYGTVGCNSICAPDPATCHRLGWHYRNMPGVGAVSSIAEDGTHLWAGVQTGLYHHDGVAWEASAGGITWWVRGVWASGGKVFAVGQRGAGDGVLAHFDGTTWRETTITGMPMFAVWGRSATDVYAVGKAGTIRHFDGTSWTAMVSPRAHDLRSVWGIGTRVIAGGDRGLVMFRDGTGAWTVSHELPAGNQIITGIWGTAADTFFAVGYNHDGAQSPLPQGGLIYITSPGPTNVVYNLSNTALPPLFAISGRGGNEVYAAGDTGTIMFFDGQMWSPMETPTTTPLRSVLAGARSVYAASNPDYFMQFDGAMWVTPANQPRGTEISALWGDGDEKRIVGVGDGCQFHVASAASADASGWEVENIGNCGIIFSCSGFFLDVWGSGSDIYVTGPYGQLFKRNDPVWDCVGQPLSSTWLHAIWGSGPNDVFIAGGDRDNQVVGLAHFNGSTWEDLSARVSPFFTVIRGIWGSAPNNVFFVGDGGTIVRYDGATFIEMDSTVTDRLRAVWGAGANDVFAVGDAGTIVHYDGTAWQRMTLPIGISVNTASNLADISGSGPNNVYAIGGRLLLHYNGTHWYPVRRVDGDAGLAVEVVSGQLLGAGADGVGARLIGNLLP